MTGTLVRIITHMSEPLSGWADEVIEEIQSIIETEILPYFEVVEIKQKVHGVCRDPEDDKFLACALSGAAQFILSGDKDLTDFKRYKSIRIIKASEFLKLFK